MIHLAFDENFNDDVVRALLRRNPGLDALRLREAGLAGAPDPDVLAWAAKQERVLVSHDVRSLTGHAYERVRAGLPMPGLIEAGRSVPIAAAIEDLLIISECGQAGEFEGKVYLPLR